MSCSCYCNCSPETTAVTVNQYTIEMDSDTYKFKHEYFTGADVSAGTLTLAETPYDADAVLVFLNSGAQGENSSGVQANFSVSGKVITFVGFTPASDDQIHVFYSYLET